MIDGEDDRRVARQALLAHDLDAAEENPRHDAKKGGNRSSGHPECSEGSQNTPTLLSKLVCCMAAKLLSRCTNPSPGLRPPSPRFAGRGTLDIEWRTRHRVPF